MKMLLGPWQLACVQLLEFYMAARLLEIFASRLRLREAREQRGVTAPREPWYPMIVIMHALLFIACGLVVFTRGNMPPRPLLVVCLWILVAALALRGWVFWSLRGRWNVHVVDPGDVVTTGPYRFIRHPNYVAVILEVIALPVAMGAYEVAILGTIANAIVLSWRIPFEERELGRQHPEYRRIMMRRPRFLPRILSRERAGHSTTPL